MDPFELSTTMEERLYERAAAFKIPLYGILELTPQCNLSCDMCYVRLSAKEMAEKGRLRTLQEWLDLAEQMQQAGALFVLLTGGEPLLYPDFQELYLRLQEMGMILTLNTNASLIDEQWVAFFAQHPPRRINITLYGASASTYRDLCHNENAYETAFRGVRLLHDAGLDIKMNASLVRTNVADWEKIMEFGESLGIPVRMDTYMYPTRRERACSWTRQSRMDAETAARMRLKVLQRELGDEAFEIYCTQTLAGIVSEGDQPQLPDTLICKAGTCSFAVSWNGNLLPCIVMDQVKIPLQGKTFLQAWEELQHTVQTIHTAPKCASCRYREACNTCAAAAIAECGNCAEVPEYICKYTKEMVRQMRLREPDFSK